MPTTASNNGNAKKELFLWMRETLLEMKTDMSECHKELTAMQVEMAVLKVKVGFYGFVGAALATGVLNVLIKAIRIG